MAGWVLHLDLSKDGSTPAGRSSPGPGGLHPEQQKPPHQVLGPVQELRQKQVEQRQLRYCNSDMHPAAFVLPEFAREALNELSQEAADNTAQDVGPGCPWTGPLLSVTASECRAAALLASLSESLCGSAPEPRPACRVRLHPLSLSLTKHMYL